VRICSGPRVAPPILSNLLGLVPSKSARCYAQSCSQRAHNTCEDALLVRSSYRVILLCETPYPDVPLLISRTAAVRSPIAKKKFAG
jgi:hypothetical protein